MWLNSDQKAAKQLVNGQHEQAYETARSDNWKATAAFRKKDYQQAKVLFNDGSADGFYNQGNSLAASGELEQALKSYEESLAIRPDDEDTLFNKKQVEDALEEQKKQEQEEKDKEDQDKEDQDEKDQDKKEGDESQDQEQKDKQDGEEKDGENKDQGDNPEQKEKQSEEGEMTEEEKEQQKKKQEEVGS